ncbi:RNA polymerase sigma-70 factor (sigma-E family) [Actinoplanes campanulatus]|uniref:RNA polymerase sigma-70 factor (Sigma-E family) n=1 Tax=Actinoplanes campanulatus TaxID=113559 RepID=A0A7W5AQ66_9ACTN|nr:SigE family RNA polymerase sigma factor [Actinoplanes campanulatus]MBB3100290.1 RNA polymerase sigma-70 factor (sigma-E family) [Actinoplanes campanulatus]GGN44036.1 DNA-directed RNA polymerase sigma-70 factor [Actinoplanes campanulatus]GID40908.1 DNA-directed RNA polymerase sigma-70 factor [Actinoplanes campanulatus]
MNEAPDFAQFVTARYPALVRYGTLLTGDRGHGEDLTQESLVKTYRAWRRLSPDGDPEAYTRTVMARAAWRFGRRLWRGEIPAATLPDRTAAGDAYARHDTAEAVLAALRALPTGQRVVLVLRYWAGLSEGEIAAQLGCSTGTVKSRASRAIASLRRADGPLAEAFAHAETGSAR